jgi:hypothetical protein
VTVAVVPIGDDAKQIRRAIAALPYRVHYRWLGDAVNRAARAIGEAFTPALRAATEAFNKLTIEWRLQGLIPPDARTLRHGTVWTSPVDGRQLRVRGRRGRPATFHWGRP